MSRIFGLFVCISTIAAAAAFFWGIAVRSYWAIAIPVAVVVVVALLLLFWMGAIFFTGDIESMPVIPTKKNNAH